MAKRDDAAAAAEQDTKGEDEVARKFREALERKQAQGRAAHGEDHKAGRGVGPAYNDHQKRQFRRKSGG